MCGWNEGAQSSLVLIHLVSIRSGRVTGLGIMIISAKINNYGISCVGVRF